jgi:glucoamylase
MEAFGKPGLPPTWATSDKDRVGTALGTSRLWFTLGHGILNEVFWPSVGRPQIRDLGFIVAREGFWREVKREARYRILEEDPASPLVEVVHEGEGYRLHLAFVPDPGRDALLVGFRLEGEGFCLYPLLAPHLGGSGWGNTAWVEEGALLAMKGEEALALLGPFVRGSAGYVGFSDGWQDFAKNGAMTWTFPRAEDGNVALMGEVGEAEGTLALAFASTPEGAKTLAKSALAEGLEGVRARVRGLWKEAQAGLDLEGPDPELQALARRSFLVLKAHEDRTYPGALVASLSVPWGNTRDDPGGYHLVWTRDAVEAAFALLALGRLEEAGRVLAYLAATQEGDGHWAQNFFPDGRPYWQGVQLDEAAFPVLLAAALKERGGLPEGAVWAMVRRAAGFLAREGPVSPQDRWEENPGLSPFTLAATVAALAAATLYGFLEGAEAEYALSLADCWNARIEEWTYVEGTPLDLAHATRGHYVRLSPPGPLGLRGRVEVRNREGVSLEPAALVGLEFLELVRLGLRSPDDPRVLDSLRLADALLRVETPTGFFYHRYPEDGYGEHEDGRPFDGEGKGRAWPLLTGERGMAAFLRGEDPLPYLRSMAGGTGRGGLIPEQVWDAEPIPERNLFPGKPTGSAQPLLWAHAEYLKLYLAWREGKAPPERLERVAARYLGGGGKPRVRHFRREVPLGTLAPGEGLLVEEREPFVLHLGVDGWQRVRDVASQPLPLGLHGVLLDLEGAESLEFTLYYPGRRRWAGRDYQVKRA